MHSPFTPSPESQTSFSWQRQNVQVLKRRFLIREMPSRESVLLRPEIYSFRNSFAAAAAAANAIQGVTSTSNLS